MRYDDYAGAIDFTWLERQLERCSATDADHPVDLDHCARAAVRNSICHCVASEEVICNAMTSSVTEAMLEGGHCR